MNVIPVLEAFGIEVNACEVIGLSGGLINATWKISEGHNEYILQRINQLVFSAPEIIDANTRRITTYLATHHPEYFFIAPIACPEGQTLVHTPDGYFRLMPYVKDSVTLHTVTDAGQAYQAARQFGQFTRLLSEFEATTLHATIPDFHNITLRYDRFRKALREGNRQRLEVCKHEVSVLQRYEWIVTDFNAIRNDPEFRVRVTHHDTKISNVLFDKEGKGICVIDIDTVMPGYFISDVGDMIRTYVSPANEEEGTLEKIEVRENILDAIKEGYLEFMGDQLTETEKEHLEYAGLFMTYMQALRFLTDYLNNDVYYGARYEGHNHVRARNQIRLLEALTR